MAFNGLTDFALTALHKQLHGLLLLVQLLEFRNQVFLAALKMILVSRKQKTQEVQMTWIRRSNKGKGWGDSANREVFGRILELGHIRC